jgi:hypothetical protein
MGKYYWIYGVGRAQNELLRAYREMAIRFAVKREFEHFVTYIYERSIIVGILKFKKSRLAVLRHETRY